MAILRAFRVAAQTGAEIGLVRIVQIAEEASPLTVVVQHIGKGLVTVVRKVISGRIVLLVTVPVSVVQLQEQSLLSEVPSVTVTSAAKGTTRAISQRFLAIGCRFEEQ